MTVQERKGFKMGETGLWNHCSSRQCVEMILSMKLLGYASLTEEQELSVLYELSNHASRHYREAVIPKRTGRRPASDGSRPFTEGSTADS